MCPLASGEECIWGDLSLKQKEEEREGMKEKGVLPIIDSENLRYL